MKELLSPSLTFLIACCVTTVPPVRAKDEADSIKEKTPFMQFCEAADAAHKSMRTASTDSTSTSSADDISDILEKAEKHEGIIISGLYLGMKIGDAQRVIAHLLGPGFDILDWECSSWNDKYWKYYIGGVPGISMLKEAENILCLMVLKTNNRVASFYFNTEAVKKIVGKKQPVSRERLGLLFFSKFDLDWTRDYENNLKMVTPDEEVISYDNSESCVFWGYNWGDPPSLSRP